MDLRSELISEVVSSISRGLRFWSSVSCFRMRAGCCVLSGGVGTFEEDVVVLADLLLDEVGGVFGLEDAEGFDGNFPPAWGKGYLSLWSSGRGGLEEALREGADSRSS